MVKVRRRLLAGERFDRLLVLEDTGERKGKAGAVVWLCLCDCGNLVKVLACNLRLNTKISCGCYRKEVLKRARESFTHFKDLTSRRFDRLLVIKSVGASKHGKKEWECLCDCGCLVTVEGSSLLQGKTRSCGCLSKDTMREIGKSNKYTKEQQFVAYFHEYARAAKWRSLDFLLDEVQFVSLVTGNCTYCGCDPHRVKQRYKNSEPIIVNGIDRVDNAKGYLYDNCVSCCYTCNIMKSAMSQQEFLSHIERILLFKTRRLND